MATELVAQAGALLAQCHSALVALTAWGHANPELAIAITTASHAIVYAFVPFWARPFVDKGKQMVVDGIQKGNDDAQLPDQPVRNSDS